MSDASVPGLKGLSPARGRAKRDPFNLQLSQQQETDFTGWLIREIQAGLDARAKIIADGGQIDIIEGLYAQAQRRPGDTGPWPDSADLASWIPTEKVDALRARLVQVVFGPSPICSVEGYGEPQEKAAKVEAFHEWKAKDEQLRTWVSKAIHSALLEGNGVLECSERTLVRKFAQQGRVHIQMDEFNRPILDEQGNPTPKRGPDDQLDMWAGDESIPSMTIHYEDQVSVCDGPQYRILSLKDFLYLPAQAADMSEVFGFAKRVWLRLPELKQRERAGYYQNVDRLGSTGDRDQRMEQSRQGITIAPQEGATAEMELWEVHLYYDIDDDGIEEWLVATVSVRHQVALRLESDSLKQVRYVSFVPYPRARSVYGYSFVGDKLWTISDEHTALRNQIADRGTLAVSAPVKRLSTALWDPDAQPWGANQVIDVRTMDEIQQQVVPDVPQSAVFQLRLAEEAAERISGLNDSGSIGTAAPVRQTATQVQTEAHASFVRIDEPVHYIQESMAALYQLRNEVWYRTLLAHEQGVIPPASALKGLLTLGLTMPQDGPLKFQAEDLRGNWSFVPKGSVETADIYRMRDDFNQFLASALPALLQLDPMLRQQFATNPKLGEALLQKALHLYRMTDLQNVLITAGPPQATAMGMPMPGAPSPTTAMMGPGVPATGSVPSANGMPPELQALVAAAMAQPPSGGVQ